jgi:hypothetical protein
MNIDEMPAGRMMDTLIDRVVFGRKWKRVESVCMNGNMIHGGFWMLEGDDPMNPPPGYSAYPSGPPSYSGGDIFSDAYIMLAVDHLAKQGYLLSLHAPVHTEHLNRWHAVLFRRGEKRGIWVAYGKTRPLAIGRTILKAKRNELNEDEV